VGQTYDGRGPLERHARAGIFLQGFAIGDDGEGVYVLTIETIKTQLEAAETADHRESSAPKIFGKKGVA
jgi:hypothetical protein